MKTLKQIEAANRQFSWKQRKLFWKLLVIVLNISLEILRLQQLQLFPTTQIYADFQRKMMKNVEKK